MYEEEKDFFYGEEDSSEALNKFKRSLITGSKRYFDVSEFEEIVEYLLEEGDINASEIAARQGIQIHPNAETLHLKYAQVLLNNGKFKDAITHLDLVEKVEPANPDVHLIKGSAWLARGDEARAGRSFRKAIKTAGEEVDDILYHIGTAYIQVGDIPTAILNFEKALVANPDNEMALFELGFFCDQQGDYKKSISYYNRYLDIDPFNYSTWFNMGITQNKAGNYGKAVEAYEFALALNDDFKHAVFNIANAYANEGKYREAIKKYYEYLESDPENDDAYCYIGECYLNMDEFKKSSEHYQKAIDLNNDNDTAWFGLGIIMWVEKKYTESIVFIRKALEIDDSCMEYSLTLSKVYSDFNHKGKALDVLKKAIKQEPDNSEIWLTWTDVFLNFGELGNAIHVLENAIQDNSDAILKYRLVSLYLEDKNEQEAFSILDTAMRQDFLLINLLFDFYPKAAKNKRLQKKIDEFRKTDLLET